MFHKSSLRKYFYNSTHVIEFGPIQLDKNLTYEECPIFGLLILWARFFIMQLSKLRKFNGVMMKNDRQRMTWKVR